MKKAVKFLSSTVALMVVAFALTGCCCDRNDCCDPCAPCPCPPKPCCVKPCAKPCPRPCNPCCPPACEPACY